MTGFRKKGSGSGTGGTPSTYTGIPDISVGGFEAGKSYSGLDLQAFGDALLSQEFFPNLSNPNNSFIDNSATLREIGQAVNITFTASFNRGTINPQYSSTSPFRSGLPNTYLYTGANLPSSVPSSALSNAQIITNYIVLQGVQAWTNRVSYDAGVQPKGSKGTDFNSPLSAGTTGVKTVSITGVYPFFGTSANLSTATKQNLILMTSNAIVDMVTEDGTDKQFIEFPVAWKNLTKLEQFNTLSGS